MQVFACQQLHAGTQPDQQTCWLCAYQTGALPTDSRFRLLTQKDYFSTGALLAGSHLRFAHQGHRGALHIDDALVILARLLGIVNDVCQHGHEEVENVFLSNGCQS